MGLADIASIPRTAEELKKWSFCHMASHRDINRLIQVKYRVHLPEFILDPIDPKNSQVWEYQHQLMHTNQNQILNIAGNDLLGVDWSNEALVESWLFLHMPEHQQAHTILKI